MPAPQAAAPFVLKPAFFVPNAGWVTVALHSVFAGSVEQRPVGSTVPLPMYPAVRQWTLTEAPTSGTLFNVMSKSAHESTAVFAAAVHHVK